MFKLTFVRLAIKLTVVMGWMTKLGQKTQDIKAEADPNVSLSKQIPE